MEKSQPSDVICAEVARISTAIANLLIDYPWQADVMRQLAETAEKSPNRIVENFSDGAIWGGSGSVCDVSFGDADRDEAKCRLLVELVECLARGGCENQRASQMAAIYRGWIKSGALRKTAH